MLGIYTAKGKEKIVVACGDFTEPGVTLQDFASLKNQIIDSERNGYGTELSDILHTFEEQTACQNEDCNRALRRIHPRIDMEEILSIIEDTPFISDLQKRFYKTMLVKRKECILDYSLEVLNRKN